MKRTIYAALLICAMSARPSDDFTRTASIVLKDASGKTIEAACIEIDGKTVSTDQNGRAFLDIRSGVYKARVHCGCGDETIEISIPEGMGTVYVSTNCRTI